MKIDTTAYVLADKAEIVQALLEMLMELPKDKRESILEDLTLSFLSA